MIQVRVFLVGMGPSTQPPVFRFQQREAEGRCQYNFDTEPLQGSHSFRTGLAIVNAVNPRPFILIRLYIHPLGIVLGKAVWQTQCWRGMNGTPLGGGDKSWDRL